MKRAEKFYDAITAVREELVEEALDYRFIQKKTIPWRRYAGLAACLALVVCIGYLAANLRMGGMNAATGNGGGDNSAAAGEAAGDTDDSTVSDGATPEAGNTTGDGAPPPANGADGGTGSGNLPAAGNLLPALGLAEEVEGITAKRKLTLEFTNDGAVYATDAYTLTNAGMSASVTLTFDDAAVSCTVDGAAAESGTQVLLDAGASTEVVLRCVAVVEEDALYTAATTNLTVTEAVIDIRGDSQGITVFTPERFDRIDRE